jgi:hypothetical protein
MEQRMPLKTLSRSIIPALALILLILPALSMAQDDSVNTPPPDLPTYDQPPIPGDGYIWTPGYWAWGDDVQDYYWVPGTWVLAPQPEFLWTPGYWGWSGGVYTWNAGYWGPHVGFYGGVNYGYGYAGSGFQGGYWQGGHLYYNRAVTNVGTVNITNVYTKTVIVNATVNHVSFNGGNGGLRAQPTPGDMAAAREHHLAALPLQHQHEMTARSNPVLRASANRGHPSIAATSRPGEFSGPGVVRAQHAGTMSVVHENPQPAGEPGSREPAPGAPRPGAPRPQSDAARQQAAPEAHRPADQAQAPRPAAPPPRPAAPPKPKPEPHPEHPPEQR